jgi:hypothetical protein
MASMVEPETKKFEFRENHNTVPGKLLKLKPRGFPIRGGMLHPYKQGVTASSLSNLRISNLAVAAPEDYELTFTFNISGFSSGPYTYAVSRDGSTWYNYEVGGASSSVFIYGAGPAQDYGSGTPFGWGEIVYIKVTDDSQPSLSTFSQVVLLNEAILLTGWNDGGDTSLNSSYYPFNAISGYPGPGWSVIPDFVNGYWTLRNTVLSGDRARAPINRIDQFTDYFSNGITVGTCFPTATP